MRIVAVTRRPVRDFFPIHRRISKVLAAPIGEWKYHYDKRGLREQIDRFAEFEQSYFNKSSTKPKEVIAAR
jgi:hypothetical protein